MRFSKQMRDCYEAAQEPGVFLIRHKGRFRILKNILIDDASPSFVLSTVEALVNRGILEILHSSSRGKRPHPDLVIRNQEKGAAS